MQFVISGLYVSYFKTKLYLNIFKVGIPKLGLPSTYCEQSYMRGWMLFWLNRREGLLRVSVDALVMPTWLPSWDLSLMSVPILALLSLKLCGVRCSNRLARLWVICVYCVSCHVPLHLALPRMTMPLMFHGVVVPNCSSIPNFGY